MAAVEQLEKNRAVMLGYLAIILILTYPMILSPASVVVGHEYASVACHIWVLWWARFHLGEFFTDLIFYPHGADVIQLYGSDLLSPPLLAMIPLPLAFLYNALVVGLLLVGAMGARRLALYLKMPYSSAFLAGVFFCSAPFFQHEMLNGTSELLSTGLLPWYAWLFLEMLTRPTTKKAIGIGIVAGVLLTLSAYNPFFMLLVSLVLLSYRASHQLQPLFTKELLWKSVWAVLSFAPFILMTGWLHLGHGAGETFSRRTDWLSTGGALPDSYANLLDWIDPREGDLPIVMKLPGGFQFEYWTTCTVYLGWIGIWGIIRGWKERTHLDIGGSKWLLGLSMLIAMGPYLRWEGNAIQIFGTHVVLPAYTIGYLFPIFAVTALHAYRYTAVVILAFSMLASQKLRSLWWAVLIVLEVILWAPQPWPAAVTKIPDSPVLEYLAELPDGAVFTFPIAKENLHDLGVVLLAQTIHGKPVHEGGIHRRAGEKATQLFRDNYIVDDLSHRLAEEYPGMTESKIGFENLKELGYRYVLTKTTNEEAAAWGVEVMGKPEKEDEEWILWLL